MLRTRIIQITLLVLLFPIGWLWYWVAKFDNAGFHWNTTRLITPVISGNRVTFGYYFQDYNSNNPRISYVRTLRTDTGEINVRRVEGFTPETAHLTNDSGTRLLLQRVNDSSSSPMDGPGNYQIVHAEDCVIRSDATLEIGPLGQRLLTNSNKLVVNDGNVISVYDVDDGFRLIGEIPKPTGNTVHGIVSTANPDVIAFIRSESISNGYRFFTHLFRIGYDQITELSSWQHDGTTLGAFEESFSGKDAVYSISTNSSEVQARSVDNGQIVRRIPIDAALKNLQFRWFDNENSLRFTANGKDQLLNLVTGEMLPITSNKVLYADFLPDSGYYLINQFLNTNFSVSKLQLVKPGTFDVTDEYAADFWINKILKIQGKANQFALVGSVNDMQFDHIEVTYDGKFKLLQSKRPLKWLYSYKQVIAVIILCWLGLFQYVLQKNSGSFFKHLFSVATLIVLVVTALYFRILVNGDPMGAYRWEYQSLIGLGLAFVACTVLWSVFGQQRVGLRIVAPVAALALLLTMVYFSMGNKHGALPIMSVALSLFAVTLSIAYRLLRWRGLRLTSEVRMNAEVDMHHASDGECQANKNLQLRDIFLITAVVAFLFSIVRFVEVPAIPQVNKFMVSGALLTLSIGVFVPLIAMMRLNQGLKWIFIAVLSIVAVAFHVVAVQRVPGRLFATFWTDFQNTGESILVFAFFYSYVMLGLYRQGLRMLRRRDKGLDRNGLNPA